MRSLSDTGRIFFGIAIAIMGFLTIYYHDFPYMLIPEKHSGIPGFALIVYISGAFFLVAGVCIVFRKKTRTVSIVLGTALLLIFCFYFIPYQFIISPDYMHFGDWENAAKELALAGGAFVVAASFPGKNENGVMKFLNKLVPSGAIIFSLTIISFSIDHFLFAKEASDYVPSWIPYHLFWMYFTGTALLCSGIAIILKIRRGLAAALLGSMIFIWFIILHIPRVVVSSVADLNGEITSAMLALAYCGIAFVIASSSKNFNTQKNDSQ